VTIGFKTCNGNRVAFCYLCLPSGSGTLKIDQDVHKLDILAQVSRIQVSITLSIMLHMLDSKPLLYFFLFMSFVVTQFNHGTGWVRTLMCVCIAAAIFDVYVYMYSDISGL